MRRADAEFPAGSWCKSSYSGSQTNCVEVAWRKSSYSGAQGSCVEVAAAPEAVAVRDTKDRAGGVLPMSSPGWQAFTTRV